MKSIEKRVVLHFPGFEPLNGNAHRARYERSAKQSAAVWGFDVSVSPPSEDAERVAFTVETSAAGWRTQSRVHMFDHNALLTWLRSGNTLQQILAGYRAFAQVVLEGGASGYFRHAWRFGLFFLFPFLLTTLALLLALTIVLLPGSFGLSDWHFLWSVPLALAFFVYLYLPFSEKFHTLHLFADWEMAVALARMDRADFTRWLEGCADAARVAFDQEADEYLISSHSMGSSVAAHVIGILLEREPELFKGKRVVFATLGCAVLQCSLLSSADVLRRRVGLIARCPEIFWLDVQCLTDSINFYKVPVVTASGHADAPQASMIFIRVKQMLNTEHYRKIRRDMLRVHRQYVLGPDMRAPFDFTLLTSGPMPSAGFAEQDGRRLPGGEGPVAPSKPVVS